MDTGDDRRLFSAEKDGGGRGSCADCTRIVLVVKLPGFISFLSPFSM